ncbi:hypothetical protein [Accumulibacter sp.]|uniref:hypothetical protein n=1 Tax=Accumulibacter sp. TaxID=2053492 RepID=UPI0025F5366B|nr:hypothetical protein [Accumulibacter sp.]MCM8596670.1 hypothetical protein [Accumulibacter sp.]MCM8627662.1 hypothetical protein [Accumulibacter sp.]MDS4050818.1 hypothetical protein [Accumulibacter sp.]
MPVARLTDARSSGFDDQAAACCAESPDASRSGDARRDSRRRVGCPRPIVVALLAASAAGPASAVGSLCTAGEVIVFSCATSRKLVSVCASPDLSPGRGYLQYRFGREGAPEIVLPAQTDQGPSGVLAGTLTFAGGGGAYLRFAAAEYRYVVYSAWIRGSGSRDGVAVEKAGERVNSLRCARPVVSELGPDFFAAAGLAADSGDFNVP